MTLGLRRSEPLRARQSTIAMPLRLPAVLPHRSVEHRVKLRSSIMLGFVSFNSLLCGAVAPTRSVALLVRYLASRTLSQRPPCQK